MFKRAIWKYGQGGRFIFALRPKSAAGRFRSSPFAAFKSLRSGPGGGPATGACHPGGEAEGERSWSLTKLIESLPLTQNSEGLLTMLHRRLAATGDVDGVDFVEGATNAEDEEDQEHKQTEVENPNTVEYTPGCNIRFVWLGVERYFENGGNHIGELPRCLDLYGIKIPAFTCVLTHLRNSFKNCRSCTDRRKTL